MFKAELKNNANGCKLELFASNYFQDKGSPLIIQRRQFETYDDAKAYFLSCAHSFLFQSFDAFTFRLKSLSTGIMSGYRGGTEDNRLLFIENYWKLIELKNAFYASGTSVYLHAQLIMMNAEILINTIPRDHKLDYNYFRDMVQDLIKVAAMLLRALDQHLDENRKEWHKMTNEDIEELKNVA